MVATSSFLLRSAFAVALAATLAACGGGGGSTPATATVRFAAAPQTATTASTHTLVSAQQSPTSPGLRITQGTDVLVIHKVSLTLRDIDMERDSQSVDCKDGRNSSHLDCSDWVDGPIRVDLMLDGSQRSHELTIPLQIGTYDVISFDISVPDGGDQQERDYIAANPDIGNNSVLVVGTFNGQPFSFTTRVTGDREVALRPPLEVKADGPVSFRFDVQFYVAEWFIKRVNGSVSLIDPRTTDPADQGTIRQNIRDRIESGSLS